VPTINSAFTVAVKPALKTISSRLEVVNPVNVNVTEYVPVGNATMLKRPSPSVVTVRTLSINAGLAASTVTPGSTAPDVSLTRPAMPDAVDNWAHASAGISRDANQMTSGTHLNRIIDSFNPVSVNRRFRDENSMTSQCR
jgi:hypothetical protein